MVTYRRHNIWVSAHKLAAEKYRWLSSGEKSRYRRRRYRWGDCAHNVDVLVFMDTLLETEA